MEKISGEGAQPPPQTPPRGEGNTPSPHPTSSWPSAARLVASGHIPHQRFLDPPLGRGQGQGRKIQGDKKDL